MQRSALIIVLLTSTAGAQQPWSGIVEASRGADWSHAGATIDTTRPQCVPTGVSVGIDVTAGVNPYIQANGTIIPSGQINLTDSNTINAALQTCPANSYLLLGQGTFYIMNGITFGAGRVTPYVNQQDNWTLRGLGPDKTTLMIMSPGAQDCGVQANAICIMGNDEASQQAQYPYKGSCVISSGYSKASTQLTLTNCYAGAMPVVNQVIALDQRNDDVGLLGCTASGTTATCTLSTATLPSVFTSAPGTCVGVGGVGGNSAMSPTVTATWAASTVYASGAQIVLPDGRVFAAKSPGGTSGASTPSWASVIGASNTTDPNAITTDGTVTWYLQKIEGYNAVTKTPTVNPSVCNQITAVTTSPPTFSYTLPNGASNLAPVGPQCYASGAATSVTGVNSICGYATVDVGGLTVTGVYCVTTDGNCTAPYTNLTGALSTGRACPDARNNACDPQEISFRTQQQMVKITNVQTPCTTTCTVTIDTPLFASNWRASQNPGIWWMTVIRLGEAIENMTIDASNDGGTSVGGTVKFQQCYNCWVRNVRMIAGSRSHVWFTNGVAHSTVRDSYFFDTKRGASQSYGLEMFGFTSNILFENNICVRVVSCIMGGGSVGSVLAYNYQRDDGYGNGGAIAYMMPMENPNHDINQFNLFESNNAPRAVYDNGHGSGGVITHFRERLRGQTVPPKNNSLNSMTIEAYNRGVSVIGGVFGTLGSQTNYQINGGGGNANSNGTVWFTGITSWGGSPIPDDALVLQTLMRWNNYDVVTGNTRQCGTGSETNCSAGCISTLQPNCSEMGQQATFLPATPVPSSPLPASFYLSAKPSWYATKWGTSPWPSIGPDITNPTPLAAPEGTGDANGGAMVYQIPAGIVAYNMPFDPAYQISGANTVTGLSWVASSGYAVPQLGTLHGSFTMPVYGSFKLDGATPSAYNGIYQIFYTDGPTSDATCAVSTTSGGNLTSANGGFRVVLTRVNVTGETTHSGSCGTSVASTCISSGNCSLYVTPPCMSTSTTDPRNCPFGGWPANNPQGMTGYNVYVNQTNDPAGKFCKQNATPVALGTYYTVSNLITPTTGGTCIEPPMVSTATSTMVTFFMPQNPGGNGSGGTITAPMVQVFNADEYYGVQQVTTPSGITGHGQIVGNGKIT